MCHTDSWGWRGGRKAECSVTWGGLGEQVLEGGFSPKLWSPTRPADSVCAVHVISGVRLEFSSALLSPSGDLFLFRPPAKCVSTTL